MDGWMDKWLEERWIPVACQQNNSGVAINGRKREVNIIENTKIIKRKYINKIESKETTTQSRQDKTIVGFPSSCPS